MVAEDHYPNIKDLTQHQRQKIQELREKSKDILARYPEYDTDFSMLRWLMGWDYKIDDIIPKMDYAVETLVNLKLDKMEPETIEGINANIRAISVASTYFPGGLMCQDPEGNIVYMQALAKVHPKTLVKAGPVSELFWLSIAETEMAFKMVRKAEKETGNKLGVKIIIDLDGFSMDLLYTPTLKVYLNLLTLLQAIFPDFARRIYLINCPVMMSTVYAMISPVLSKQTREKVHFLDKHWRQTLIDEIGEENIYKHWGGSKEHNSPTGDLRMGGKVPEKLWYNSEDHPMDENKSDKTKINVPARNLTKVKLTAKQGQQFKWLWRVSSGDVDFWITHQEKVVYPKFRIMTDFHPEIGRFECEKDGEYHFVFDNSHGMMFSKDVKYHIKIE